MPFVPLESGQGGQTFGGDEPLMDDETGGTAFEDYESGAYDPPEASPMDDETGGTAFEDYESGTYVDDPEPPDVTGVHSIGDMWEHTEFDGVEDFTDAFTDAFSDSVAEQRDSFLSSLPDPSDWQFSPPSMPSLPDVPANPAAGVLEDVQNQIGQLSAAIASVASGQDDEAEPDGPGGLPVPILAGAAALIGAIVWFRRAD